MKRKKIVVIGGGTGTFTVLTGLKKYPVDLTAVVAMSDDGGSTGVLRDELGVLPPGDVRQCLVALSESPEKLRRLMNYRFAEGGLRGHSFGNLFLSALEKMTGSFDEAVEIASELLRIKGHVIPATLRKVQLVAELKNGKIVRGQNTIHQTDLARMRRIRLEPAARGNPKAIQAIRHADAVVIGPGDLYSSLIPNMLVKGIPEAVQKSKAVNIYVCNLMTKKEHTAGFSVGDYARTIERYLKTKIDRVLYNTSAPTKQLLSKYAREGEYFVPFTESASDDRFYGAPLVSKTIYKGPKGDLMPRTLIRHDSHRLARNIMKVVNEKKKRVA